MEQNRKPNSFKRSETMSTGSNQSKSISSKGGIPKNVKSCRASKMSSSSCEPSIHNANSSAPNDAVSSVHSSCEQPGSQYKTVSNEQFHGRQNTIARDGEILNDAPSSVHSSYEQPGNHHKTMSSEKSHGIRGFLKLLPFLPRFKHKTNSNKQKIARKQTSRSRIQIFPSSSLEENDVRKLIRLYQYYENLYNPKHPNYGNRTIEDMCYSKIAGKFPNKTSQELQSLLYELRLLFEREYTIIENRQRRFGQFVLPSIKYYSEFLFLVPFLDFKWENGACLPPKIEEETKSCPSDGTDWSRRSSKDLASKDLIKVNSPTNGEKSSLEVTEAEEEEVKPNPLANYLTGAQENSSNIVRPAAGKNLLNTPPLCYNQFMCFGKKKDKAEKKEEEKLENQSLDATIKEPLEEQTSQILEKEKSLQSDPMSRERTSLSEVSRKENPNEIPESAFSVPQKRLSKTPCQGNEDREPCETYCNQNRPQTSSTSRPETFTNANITKISNPTHSGNQEQLQILCDMIKMELSSSPDFIYYDAKWRIIEILREVQKRNLIHSKSHPENKGNDSVIRQMCKCPLNAICKKHEEFREEEPPRCRIRGPLKATQCPYCCCKRC